MARQDETTRKTPGPPRVTKKDQIIALYLSGITNVEDLAIMTDARPSYVGAVLQRAGHLQGYFDLYTSTAHPMNVYSKLFTSQLGFKNEATARKSITVIDRWYRQFETAGDRAGQHHALSMALVMFDRARWTGKRREADIFRQWLLYHLEQAQSANDEKPAVTATRTAAADKMTLKFPGDITLQAHTETERPAVP